MSRLPLSNASNATGTQGRSTPKQGRAASGSKSPGSIRWALIFLAPTTIGLAIFNFWPMIRTFYFSFTEWGPFGGHEFTGLQNFHRLIDDPEVWRAIGVTLAYAAMQVLALPIAAVVATMLNQRDLRWLSGFRVLYFLPVVTMPVAAAMVWRLLLNGDYGPINEALSFVNIDGPRWLTQPGTALIALGLVGIWISLGQQIIILLAGLQGIPRELYEAGDLDGVGTVQKFWYITLPLLTPTIFFLMILTTLNSLQMFDILFVMLDPSNPAIKSIKTIVYLFYETGFVDNDRGYAAAIAFLLLALILLFTIVQFRLQKRWVHYQ